MKSFLFTIVLVFSFSTFAADFLCSNQINGQEVSQVQMKTKVGSRIEISDESDFISYMSERSPNEFTLEFYSREDEIRVYSEASVINEKDSITAATWSHAKMITVKCHKTKN
jgi:hypothetical protein